MEILFEDKDLIVVVKPKGMPTQADLSGDISVKEMIEEHIKHESGSNIEPFVAVIHRLDRPVRGVLVFAKTKFAARELNKSLQNNGFKKTYEAVVMGKPQGATLKDYLSKTKKGVAQVVEKEDGKLAELTFETKDTKTRELEGIVSLLEIALKTGRFHQIRIQMANHGYPLVGDTKYNDFYKGKRGWFDIGLNAKGLSFPHPKTKETITFESPATESPFDLFR